MAFNLHSDIARPGKPVEGFIVFKAEVLSLMNLKEEKSMKSRGLILASVFASMFALAACEQKGPAEKLGENIDEATQDVGNAVEDACEDIKDAAGAKDKDC